MSVAAERKVWKFPHSDHLSPSQVTEYLNCPLCFKLNRIDRAAKPMGVALPIGGAVHWAVEGWRKQTLEGWPAFAGDAHAEAIRIGVDMAAEHFDHSLEVDPETDGEIMLDLGDYHDIGEAKDHAVNLTKFVLPEIAKLDAQRGLIAAEMDLSEYPSPFPFPMHGRVDALYGPEPDLCSMGEDLKTSSRQASPDFMAALQLAIYRAFLPVTWLADVVAKGSPKTRGGERVGWNSPSLLTYSLSDEGDDFVRELVLEVADRICRGDFPARPGYRCRFEHGNPTFSLAVSGFEEVT